jgi:hypothetical protein
MAEYIAFDLEIAKELPNGADDWKAHRPLGITCAAMFDSDGNSQVWHSNYGPKMGAAEVVRMLNFLGTANKPVVTWNGLGFDFDVLAEEAWFNDAQDRARTLALNHIDIAFQMFCEKGFMCGLDAAAKGMGLSGKTEGMRGDLAPAMWKQGRKERDLVLEYVAQDARTTAEVYEAVLERGTLSWVTKRGGIAHWVPTTKDGRLLTCTEALELELPDTSWMTDPWPREKFTEWVHD